MSADGKTLYVADTDNHAVRAVDLERRAVRTLAGNGEQGFDYSGGRAGAAQYLSSPWDVVLPKGQGQGQGQERQLLVAMAGTHQIWGVDLPAGKAACYSGACVRSCACVCARARVCVCVRACVRACMYVCMSERLDVQGH